MAAEKRMERIEEIAKNLAKNDIHCEISGFVNDLLNNQHNGITSIDFDNVDWSYKTCNCENLLEPEYASNTPINESGHFSEIITQWHKVKELDKNNKFAPATFDKFMESVNNYYFTENDYCVNCVALEIIDYLKAIYEALSNKEDIGTIVTIDEFIETIDAATFEEDYDIMQYWLVSDFLASKLESLGEFVVESSCGYIWGRCTVGQSIYMDSVIQEISADIEGC